jgi:PEP-CTERM motif
MVLIHWRGTQRDRSVSAGETSGEGAVRQKRVHLIGAPTLEARNFEGGEFMPHRMGFLWTTLSLCAAAVLMAAPSQADIIFNLGNSTASDNIGAYTETGDLTATGHFLGGGPVVMDVETDTNLTVPANGAARVEAEGTLFTTVTFTPVGLNWLTIELNPQIEPGGDTGTFFLTAIDDDGDVFTSATFTLGNGENRVFAQAINGQSITGLLLSASGPLVHDVRQVRITQGGAVPVPEPSSIILLGLGGAGLLSGYWARRRSA